MNNRNSIGHRIARTGMVVVSAAVLLAGCASLPSGKPEDVVADNAQAYWNAIIAGNWDKAYALTTPGYRAAVDMFNYRRSHDGFVKYNRAEVLGVNCEEAEVCKVKMRLHITISSVMKTDSIKVIEERWLSESGGWYRYIKR